jgi:hypothetical protein
LNSSQILLQAGQRLYPTPRAPHSLAVLARFEDEKPKLAKDR